jgi:hypothetical protein
MRQGSTGRRSRGRPNRKQHGGQPRSGSYDSSGPEGRIRGNAHQIYERYVGMARDALSSGDRIAAETYFQHAEHYFRIMNARNEGASGSQGAARHRGNGHAADWATGETQVDEAESPAQQPAPATKDTAPAAPAADEAAAAEAPAAGRRQPRAQGRRRGGRSRSDDQPESGKTENGERTVDEEAAGT